MENDFVQQAKDELTGLGQSFADVSKLRLVGVVSRILGLFLLIFTVVLLVLALLSFGAVAVINALSNHMPIWAAALILAGVYSVLIAVTIALRKPLFIHPFIRLMTQQCKTQEELDVETLKAEHKLELRTVRIENNIENATRGLNMFANTVGRVWNFIFARKK